MACWVGAQTIYKQVSVDREGLCWKSWVVDQGDGSVVYT